MNFRISEAPETIVLLAERCIAHVKSRVGFELDYHQDTLSVVDHSIQAIVAEEGEGTVPPPGHKRRAHLVHLLAPTYGAYFGEVLRRTFPCRWRLTADDPESWALEFEEVFLKFNPVGAVAEAIFGDKLDDWGGTIVTLPAEQDGLLERLAASPPVFEDQFFALTTRLEVIQIANDWLHSRLQDEDKGSKVHYYAPEDYDRLLRVP